MKTWTDKHSIIRMFFKRVEIEQFLSVTDIYVSAHNTIYIEESIKLSSKEPFLALELSTIAIRNA